MTEKILFKTESYQIIKACINVHNELGAGFLENVYQEALQLEFTNLGIPYAAEKQLQISYKSQLLKSFYRADFICYNKILIETKAVDALLPEHEAQVINYLKATGLQLGLIVNFSKPRLEYKRLVRLPDYQSKPN